MAMSEAGLRSMATLHNPEDIVRKDIRPGEPVVIEKAGDVIPRVVGPAHPTAPDRPPRWVMPTACPVCGSQLQKPEDEAVWRCENSSCPSKLRRGLEHFASLGIEAEVLPVRTREDADRPDLASSLQDASVVYLSGGNPAHLSDVLRDTAVWAAELNAKGA